MKNTDLYAASLNKRKTVKMGWPVKTLGIILVSVIFSLSGFSQALLIDNFDYPAGTSLITSPVPGYTLQGTGTVPMYVASEGLSYPGYASSGIGNAAQFVGPADGMDPFKPFVSSALTTGSVYVSCLVKITATTTAGEYFLANKIDGSTSGTASVVRARVYCKGDGANGVSFGIAKGTTPPTAGWTPFTYQLNTTYLLVYKYTFVTGTTNDNVDLFINPVVGSPEPTPTISYADLTTSDAAGMKCVMLTQRANGPSALVDGLRVATNWADAVAFDNVAPVATFVPANGTTDVLRTVTPTISFNEPILKADGTPVTNSDLATLVDFRTNNSSGTNVPFTAIINDAKTVITVTPSSVLEYSQQYYLAVGPVKDGSGNLSSTQSSTFTTLANTISNDATLSDLKVDGSTVAGFSSSTYAYSVILPYGTTLVPTVTATPTFGLATVDITPAVSIPGTTNVLVTAQDGVTQLTYTVTFTLAPPSNDANLSNLRWIPNSGSQSIYVTGFSPQVTTYSVELPAEVTAIAMTASVSGIGATITTTPPSDLSGSLAERTGTVVVTAQDGVTTKTYSVVFSLITGLSYHFKEGFAAFPPTNWTYTGNISLSTANGVSIYDPGLSSSKFKWTAPLDGGTLVSPPINTAGILEFFVRVLDNDTSHQLHFYVEKSTDGGTNWSLLGADPMPMTMSTAIWHQVKIAVNDPGSSILIRLRGAANTGTNTQGLFYVDDMSVSMSSSADATLSDLKVNGTTVAGFSTSTYSYNVVLPAGTSTYPVVTATPTQPAATVAITNATTLPGTATVLVTAPNGVSTNTYTVNFSVELSAPYNLAVTSNTPAQTSLSWSDNNLAESGFKIERRPNNGFFALVGTVPANTTTYTNTTPGLNPNDFVPANRFSNVTVTSGVQFANVVNYQGVPTTLYLDVYEPTGDATLGRPVIIWIHGGGFRTGSVRTQGYIVDYCTRFAKRGYVCMSIDYRLRDAASMPTQASEFPALQDAARDANAAIDWIRANAAAYHVDPNLVFIAGGSAGGRTAQTVCQFDGPDPTAIYPPENLYISTPWNKTGLIANATLWGGLEPEMRGWVYPYLQPTDIPTVLVHGDADVTILPQNSIDLDDTLTSTGVTSELHIIPGATHSCLGYETQISEWVAAFFAQEWTKAIAVPTSYAYRVCAYNSAGNSAYSTEVLTARTLNVTAFLEGLYENGLFMRKAQNESGDQFSGKISDQVTLELHNATNYATVEFTASNVDLSTIGKASVLVPVGKSDSYYLTIKHRNHLETVSAVPVSFAGQVASYNFTTAATQAFANNLKHEGAKYCLYGGDVNQDGIVDSGDMIPLDNEASQFSTGYIITDVNGDGLIDSGDMIVVDNNSSEFIGVVTP